MGFITGMSSGMEFGIPHYYIDDGACTDCEVCLQGLDVAISLDYTGSMSDIIEAMKGYIGDVAATIDSLVDPAKEYRLSLQLVDESVWDTDNNTWLFTPSYWTKSEYTNLPSSQRFVNIGGISSSWSYYAGRDVHFAQIMTTMEVFQVNNLSTFETQLNKINEQWPFAGGNLPLGMGFGTAEPYDISIFRMIDGSDGIGAWRKGVARIGITFADNLTSGDDDSYGTFDYQLQDFNYAKYDLSAKCRINNIRWMRFGDYAELVVGSGIDMPWPSVGSRTDGAVNNSYVESVVSNAIIDACGRGDIPYRMLDSNGDIKAEYYEFIPYSWNCGITTGAANVANYLDFGDIDAWTIDDSTGMTFSIWVKPDELTSQKILHKDGEYEIGTDSSDKLFFSITTNNGTMKITTTTSPLTTTDWQHVLCTWDGTYSDVSGMKIYWADGDVNGGGATHTEYSSGSSNITDDSTGSTGTSVTNTSNNLLSGTANTTTAGYDGKISDIAIYKSVLHNIPPDSQIALILNDGRPGNIHNHWNDINVDWLIGYWRPLPASDIIETGTENKLIYGWESKNATFYGSTTGSTSSNWCTDVPSALGQ